MHAAHADQPRQCCAALVRPLANVYCLNDDAHLAVQHPIAADSRHHTHQLPRHNQAGTLMQDYAIMSVRPPHQLSSGLCFAECLVNTSAFVQT